MRREAGTLAFEGSFRDGRGAGLFTFAPRAAYTAEMRSLGFNDDLDLWRRYQLAVHDVGPRYIRDLKTEGFDKLHARSDPARQNRTACRSSTSAASRLRASRTVSLESARTHARSRRHPGIHQGDESRGLHRHDARRIRARATTA